MAGGFPVSAIAGRRALMQSFGDLSVTHSGTYNSSVYCMAATLAALNMLSADDGARLQGAHAIGARLMSGIQEAGQEAGVRVRGVPTVFHVSFGGSESVVDYRTFTSRDTKAGERFWLALQERGIRTTPDGLWFVSTAHTQADADRTLAAVAEAMNDV